MVEVVAGKVRYDNRTRGRSLLSEPSVLSEDGGDTTSTLLLDLLKACDSCSDLGCSGLIARNHWRHVACDAEQSSHRRVAKILLSGILHVCNQLLQVWWRRLADCKDVTDKVRSARRYC